MPLIQFKPDVDPPVLPNLPRIEPASYKSILTDDNRTPVRSLIPYMAGAGWNVEYYSQVMSEHTDLREVDSAQSGIYQQYQLIHNLEVRVESPLSDSFDSTQAISSVTGSGLIHYVITPNVSDYFITDTADSKKAIFRVTEVDRKSFKSTSVFSIEYEMVGYAHTQTEIADNLAAKTIREYHFHKERLISGLEPLVRTDIHNSILNLDDEYHSLVEDYLERFLNTQTGSLVVPGQSFAIYDYWLVQFIKQTVSLHRYSQYTDITFHAVDGDVYLKQPTIWTMLLKRQLSLLPRVVRNTGVVSKLQFNRVTYLKGFYFSSVDYLIYPLVPETDLNVHLRPMARSPMEYMLARSEVEVATHVTSDSRRIPISYGIGYDESYVLSDHFYNQDTEQSVLEILVKDYLQSKSLNVEMLSVLCKEYHNWPVVDQFYYCPIILTLIKSVLNEIRT